jgi:hypothetical protein
MLLLLITLSNLWFGNSFADDSISSLTIYDKFRNYLNSIDYNETSSLAVQFISFGRAIEENSHKLFKGPYKGLDEELINAGLIAKSKTDNKLFLSIHGQRIGISPVKSGNDQTIYIAHDISATTPVLQIPETIDHYISNEALKPDYVLVFDSGNGAASIDLLMKYPNIERIIGLENDSRLITLSRFNAKINSVSDRFTVWDSHFLGVLPVYLKNNGAIKIDLAIWNGLDNVGATRLDAINNFVGQIVQLNKDRQLSDYFRFIFHAFLAKDQDNRYMLDTRLVKNQRFSIQLEDIAEKAFGVLSKNQ